MLQIQTIENFNGFGETNQPGEYYHSENMRRGQFGLASLLSNQSLADSVSLSGLLNVQVFADGALHNPAGSGGLLADAFESVFGQSTNGTIYVRRTDQDTWAKHYKPSETFFGAGMMLGDDSFLYYVGDRYLGQAAPWAPTINAGTISVTNSSPTVTGSGTFFLDPDHVDRRIKIAGVWYTILSVTTSTSLTLTSNYAGATQSGLSYDIYVDWKDKFQDFGSALSSGQQYEWATPFNYEGDLLIPRKNKLCRLNSDGSFNDETHEAFNLPESPFIRCGAGGTNKILLGAEVFRSSRSYLILWDNFSDRSIAPWIPLKSRVQAIKCYDSGWIVVTQREIIYTDGYSIRVISEGIDPKLGENSFSLTPYGLQIIGDRAIISNQIGGYTRKRSGIYIFSIPTGAYQYLAPLGTHTYNTTPYAVFLDTAQKLNLSLETTLPAKKHLTLIKESAPARASLITNPLTANGNKKNATGVKLDMAALEGGETITVDITVKLASLNRRLWGIQKAKIAGTQTNRITVNGTQLGDVRAGDEITIMEGVNAGTTRHILSISGGGTSTEVWTLDEALGSNIEQDAYINITPFRKVAKKTVTSATELRDMYFDVMNKYKGKRFLVKTVISNATVPIEILEVSLLAQDQGVRT